MGDQVRLARGRPRPPGRGARKPGARHLVSERASPAAFQAFGELQQREFERSPWPMRIFEHGTFRFLAVNDAAVKLYGYTREEFLAMTAKDTRHSEELDDFLTTLDEPTGYFRHRGPRRHVKKNGEVIVVEAVTQDIQFNGRKARLSMNIDVTERKRIEQVLRENEARFSGVVESAMDAIITVDSMQHIVLFNVAAERMFGYPAAEIVGQPLDRLIPARYREVHRSHIRSFGETGATARSMGKLGNISGLRASGEDFSAEASISQLEIDGEKLFTVILRDVTERKVVERALHESESKYRNLVESSSDLIWSTDAEGRITFINEAVRRIYGYEPEEMLGRPLVELLGGGHTKKSFGFFRTMLSEDRSASDYECEAQHKNGERVVLSSNAIVLRDDAGNRLGVSGISKDITARKRMEAALRESEERFRQLADNIREVFWISKLGGENIYVSPGYEDIWRRSLESLNRDPHSWIEAIYPDDLPAVLENQERMTRGQLTDIEYRIIRPDGALRWIRDRSYPMKRGDGTRLICGIADDITDIKQAEQARLAQAAQQRDALVREVHHRIKNSLQGVAGLLRQKIGKYPAIAPGIEEAVAQLQSVALVYGLQETRPDGLLDLAEITNAICSSAESLIGGRVERTFERNSQRPACLAGAEAVSVAVAINELVFNALKHQPAEAGEKRARVTLCETGDAAEIRITNRGRLPAGFDYAGGAAVGNGLGLVRTLLASPGGAVAFNGGPNDAEVIMKLTPPLLADRQETIAK
jgi:PAS domain S-box-containing protein